MSQRRRAEAAQEIYDQARQEIAKLVQQIGHQLEVMNLMNKALHERAAANAQP